MLNNNPNEKLGPLFLILTFAILVPLVLTTILLSYFFAPGSLRLISSISQESVTGRIVFYLWFICSAAGVLVLFIGSDYLTGRNRFLMWIFVLPVIIWPYRLIAILIITLILLALGLVHDS